MTNDHLEDVRYQRILAMLRSHERLLKEKYKDPWQRVHLHGKLKEVEKVKKDLESMGWQLDGTYLEQLPLVPDVPAKKAVQTR